MRNFFNFFKSFVRTIFNVIPNCNFSGDSLSYNISINLRICNSVVLVSHRITLPKHESWFSDGRKNLTTDPYLSRFWKPEGNVLNGKVLKVNKKTHYTHPFGHHWSSRHCNVDRVSRGHRLFNPRLSSLQYLLK